MAPAPHATLQQLMPAMHQLRQMHPGIGRDDEFDMCLSYESGAIRGSYYNAALNMREAAVIFEDWELRRESRSYLRDYVPRMLALVDKVYDRVKVAKLSHQATLHFRRPGPYRPGAYRPEHAPRLIYRRPLLEKLALEKLDARMAA